MATKTYTYYENGKKKTKTVNVYESTPKKTTVPQTGTQQTINNLNTKKTTTPAKTTKTNTTNKTGKVGGGVGGTAPKSSTKPVINTTLESIKNLVNKAQSTSKTTVKPAANKTVAPLVPSFENKIKSQEKPKVLNNNLESFAAGGKKEDVLGKTFSAIFDTPLNNAKKIGTAVDSKAVSGKGKTAQAGLKGASVNYTDMYNKMNSLDFSKLQAKASEKQKTQQTASPIDQWNEQYDDWNTLQQYKSQFDSLYDAELAKQRQNVPDGYVFVEPTQAQREQAFADTMKEWGAEEYLGAKQPETMANADSNLANAQSAYDAALAQKPEAVKNYVNNPGPATWIYYNMWKMGHQDEAKALEAELKGLKDDKKAKQEFRDNVLTQEEYYKAINDYGDMTYAQSASGLSAKKAELDSLEKNNGAQDDIDKLKAQIEALQAVSDNAHISELESVRETDPQFKTKADQAVGKNSDLEDYLNDSTFVKMFKNTLNDDLAVQNFMTQDEIDMYNYWFTVGGQEKAHEYIYAILPELKERTAEIKAENSTAIGRLGYSLSAGYQSFFGGTEQAVRRAFGDKTVVDPSMDQMIQQKFMENTKGIEAVANNVVYTVGNLLPTAAATLATGGTGAAAGAANLATAGKTAAEATAKAISTGMIGTSSFGNAYTQARNEGYSDQQSIVYASMTGGSEAFLTYFLTGVKVLGGGTATNAAKKKIGSVLKRVAKTEKGAKWLAGVGSHIAESGGEATEEYLQQTFDPIFRNISFGENNDVTLMSEDQIYAAVMGAAVSEIMNAPYTVGNGKAKTAADVPVITSKLGAQKAAEILGEDANTQVEAAQNTEPITGNATIPKISMQEFKDNNAVLDNRRLTENDLQAYIYTGKRLSTRNAKTEMLNAGDSPILTNREQTSDFIDGSIKGAILGKTKAYGIVGKNLADAVKEASNGELDIEGKYLELSADYLKHSFDEHHNPKQTGNISLSERDYENIPDYIDSFDRIYGIDIKRNSDGKLLVATIKLAKKINGYTIIVETVSNERGALHLRDMWGVSTESYEKAIKNKSKSVGSRGHGTELTGHTKNTTIAEPAFTSTLDIAQPETIVNTMETPLLDAKVGKETMDAIKSEIEVGEWVYAKDRDNIGQVVGKNENGEYIVNFRNPETGEEASATLRPDQVQTDFKNKEIGQRMEGMKALLKAIEASKKKKITYTEEQQKFLRMLADAIMQLKAKKTSDKIENKNVTEVQHSVVEIGTKSTDDILREHGMLDTIRAFVQNNMAQNAGLAGSNSYILPGRESLKTEKYEGSKIPYSVKAEKIIPPEIRRRIDETIARIKKDFPGITDAIQSIRLNEKLEEAAQIHTVISAHGTVVRKLELNPAMWSSEKTLLEEYNKLKLLGLHVPAEDPYSIIAHEMGHLVHQNIALDKAGYYINNRLTQKQFTAFQREYEKIIEESYMAAFTDETFKEIKGTIIRELGLVAANAPSEFIADSFASVYFMKNPSRHAKLVVKYLKRG